METSFKQIEQWLKEGKTAEAEQEVDALLAGQKGSAGLYCLKGRIRMKHSDWQGAITAFLHAEELDPDSPAHESRLMVEKILQFYHKDLYNP